MIRENLNPQRYEFLVKTIAPYLKDFFKNKYKTLGALRIPIRSIPSTPQQAVITFMGMPEKALPIIREWFSEKLIDEKLPDPISAMNAFVLDELNLKKISTNEEKNLFGNSLFLNLISESPPESILHFMSLPLGITSKFIQDESSSRGGTTKVSSMHSNVQYAFSASEIYSDLDPLDLNYLCHVERVSDAAGIAFLRPLAFYTPDGNFYECSTQEWLDFLPSEGNIIWYGSRANKRHLEQGHYGVFSIRDVNDPAKSIKYAVDELLHQIFPVIDCSLRENELEKLRNWFMQNQMVISKSIAYVRLSGDIFLKSAFFPNGNIDLDKPVELFTEPHYILIGKNLYSEDLGRSDKFIDLCSPEVFLKKFLNRNSEPFKTIPRDFLALLIEELRSSKEGFSIEKTKQLLTHIDEIAEKRDVVDLFVAQFRKTDVVKKEIANQISEAVDKSSKEIETINSKVKELQKTRDNLIKSVEREHEKQKKERQALYLDIKSTFERGMADGRKTLAEAALFGAILDPRVQASPLAGSSMIASNNNGPKVERLLTPKSEAYEDVFKKLRFKTNGLPRFFDAVEALIEIGLTPAFQGSLARIFARALANNLDVKNVIEVVVTPGMEYSSLLLEPESDPLSSSSVILYNFNLSPINVYAHDLLDKIYGKFLSGKNHGPNVILTFDDSGLGLDYPPALDFCMAIIDTDNIDFNDEEINLDDFKIFISEDVNLEPHIKQQLDFLRRSLESYSHENEVDLPVLFGLLRKTYLSRFISEE